MLKPSDYIRKGWCQRVRAIDNRGYTCEATDPGATRWCMYGAILAAYHEDMQYREHLVSTIKKRLGKHIALWNDNPLRTQDEVVAVLESIGE